MRWKSMQPVSDHSLLIGDHFNNLIAIIALPAMWSGAEPERVLGSLLEALMAMLPLNFVYGELHEANGHPATKMTRTARSSAVTVATDPIASLTETAKLGDWPSDVKTSTFRLGLGEELGRIVAGSSRPDFPDPYEKLLLNVAANQAAIWLLEARRLSEQKEIGTQLKRDKKLAEDQLRQTQGRLARASQIVTAAAMTAAIAHEINQPLGAVMANAQASLRWLSAPSPEIGKARDAIQLIVRDGNDVAEVVRRTKALFAGARPVRTLLHLNELAEEVLRLLSGEVAKRTVVIRADFEPELPLVLGDRLQIQQLLMNLIMNALEATDPVEDRAKAVTLRTARHSSDLVRVEITDNGVGLVDPARAFEAFFTTKASGIGMGLAICRTIVENHEGELWAESNPETGTTFAFTLLASAAACNGRE